MKKKNIAMMMAGVTVASAVAPVFANNIAQGEAVEITINSKNASKLVSEVDRLLTVKYDEVKAGVASQVKDGRVYLITINNKEITNATELQNKINALTEGKTLEVKIVDKGHQIIDNKVVDYKFEQYKSVEEIVTLAEADGFVAKAISTEEVEVKRTETSTDVVKVKVGDDKLDFTSVIEDKKSNLVGFEKNYMDIVDGEASVITVKNSNAELTTVDAADLYDGIRITSEGNVFFDKIEKEKTMTGQTVTVENEKIFDAGFSQADGKAKFDIVVKNGDKELEVITVANEDQHLVRKFAQMVKDIIAGKDVKAVNVVAGDTRFTTAVEVSKQRFEDGKANAVILVGEDAIVDGLAAAPLATQENAPILLAKQNELTKETEEEIIRALGTTGLSTKTIYIVGGEARISKELETKLAKLGAKVERLAGESRQETSIEIAKKLNKYSNAFVVGADGEADAMSISARAAQFKSPIIVADKEVLNEKTKELLDGKDIEIIGGVNAVSESIEAELKEIDKDNTITRLAGETRKDTNAAVINKYYSSSTTSAFIAKDGYVGGNGKLIDALTAAPLAAEAKAPIILTTDELSKSQEEVLELRLSGVTKLTQVGNGIVKSVVEKIAEKINFFR